MAVTLKEIAQKAGVSSSTVSHAIRGNSCGKRSLSPDTVQKIRDIANSLGYRPNMLARGLSMSRTYTLGVLIAALRGDFYERILEGIANYVHPEGFTPLLAIHNYDPQRERKELEAFMGKRVDGIIAVYSGYRENIRCYREIIENYRIPLVLVDREVQDLECPLVRSDHYGVTFAATQELQNLGHRNIAYVAAGTSSSPSTQVFTQGYEAAMQGSGLTHVFARTSSNPWSATECRSFASGIVDFMVKHPEFTGIIVQVDWLAYEIMAQLKDLGIEVPDQISVMGCDDNSASSFNLIGLSSFRTNLEEVGRKSAEMLLSMVKGEEVFDNRILVPAAGFCSRKTTRRI